MTVIARDPGCNCALREDGSVSVIGACGCPVHGMKALTRERDDARQQLEGAVTALREIELGGYTTDSDKRYDWSASELRYVAGAALRRLGRRSRVAPEDEAGGGSPA